MRKNSPECAYFDRGSTVSQEGLHLQVKAGKGSMESKINHNAAAIGSR